ASHTSWPVSVARAGEAPQPGAVLVAGTNDHLILQAGGTLAYTPEPVSASYRPSVDVFFASLRKHWKGRIVAALLTGMGRDGAVGLKALRSAGAYTVAQA